MCFSSMLCARYFLPALLYTITVIVIVQCVPAASRFVQDRMLRLVLEVDEFGEARPTAMPGPSVVGSLSASVGWWFRLL